MEVGGPNVDIKIMTFILIFNKELEVASTGRLDGGLRLSRNPLGLRGPPIGRSCRIYR